MTTQRILLLSYIVLGVLVGLVLEQAFLGLSGFGPLTFLSREILQGWSIATLLGFAAAGGLGFFCWRHPRISALSTQVVEEMQRVTWPTMAETRAATYAVVMATLVFAVMLGVFDYAWGMLTEKVYSP